MWFFLILTPFYRPSAGTLLNHPFFKQVRNSFNLQINNYKIS